MTKSRLIAMTPPRGSGWSLFGPHEVGPPYPQVLDSEGNHSLGWRLGYVEGVLMIEFSLNRMGENNEVIPFKTTKMRAEPTFSQFLGAFRAVQGAAATSQ